MTSSGRATGPDQMRNYPEAATIAWYLAINRDLRRAALLAWIMPFSAALSRETTAAFTAAAAASVSPAKMSCSALVIAVFTWLRTDLLRALRRAITRTCLFADFVFANRILVLGAARCAPVVK